MCENHDYYHIKMSEAHNKILKFNQDQRSLKILFVIYADTELLLGKMHICDSDSKKMLTSKINTYGGAARSVCNLRYKTAQ